MTRENFLSRRLNNAISLGLGLITLAYVVVAVSSSAWSGNSGFTGLAIIGVLM